jgi:Lrp/AsnC family transcriptional regulator, leucine-responsive regulatory protein
MGPTNEPVDKVDLALLAALRDDGRATVQTLAERVKLSPAATSVRLGRLKEKGLYRGIHADVDEIKLGYQLCAYLLLRINEASDRMAFTARIFELPEVTEIAWVTGEHDVLLTCWGKDTRHLEAVIETILATGARSTTMLVLGRVYRKPGIQFEAPPTPPISDPELPIRAAARARRNRR